MKRMRRRCGVVGLCLWMCGVSFAVANANVTSGGRYLYVSMTGSNTNPGTKQQPFGTLQYAANKAKPGDTVEVRGGTYCQRLAITISGNSKAGYITFRSAPGEAAILDGGCLLPGQGPTAMISLHNVSYVRIEDFEVRNYKTNNPNSVPFGIWVHGYGSHIQILANNIHSIEQLYQGRQRMGSGGNAHGVGIYGTNARSPLRDVVLEGNRIHDLHTGSSESVTLSGNVTHFVVSRNRIYDDDNIGIDIAGYWRAVDDVRLDRARNGVVSGNIVYDISSEGNPAYGLSPSRRGDAASDGIYVDGGTRVVIERNIVHNVDFGIEMASENFGHNTSYVIARNNLVYFCHDAGISIGGYGRFRGGTNHVTIVNNTLYMDNAWHEGTGEFYMQLHMRNNRFENNIIYIGGAARATHSRSGPAEPGTPAVVMDHNLFYSSGGSDAVKWSYNDRAYSSFQNFVGATGGARQVFANPEFVDVDKEDFHLRRGSPAVDSGVDLGAAVVGTRDLDGRLRTTRGRVDLGCYQDR